MNQEDNSNVNSSTEKERTIGMLTDVGKVRTIDEDSILAADLSFGVNSESSKFLLLAVADGMGGHAKGEEASKIALNAIARAVIPELFNDTPFTELLEKGIQNANQDILDYTAKYPESSGMGTTSVCAVVTTSAVDGFDIDVHWSRISSATGLSLMPKAITDYWATIGVKVNFIEHEQPHFIDLINKRSLKPVVLQTFRRQANSGQRVFVTYLFNALYPSAWDEEINDLAAKILTSLDKDEQLKLMAELEDKVFSLKETFPIYAMSRINAYSDRVLAHPTPAYARHFLDLDRIILRN